MGRGNRWGLALAIGLIRVGFGFQLQTIASLGPELTRAFGIDYAMLGTLVGVYMASGVVVALPAGFAARRFGDFRVAVFGLTFMVGGPDAAFATVRPLFDVMGQKAVHCGGSGAGQSAKICNNMILGVTMIATCEAFALADKLGLDRQKMFDVVSTSSGASWSMNAYCPAPGVGPKSPADTGYKPGFAAELMLKDLRLSQQAAEAADADTPMGALARQLYETFVEQEGGRGRDFSAMLPRFEGRHRE